MSEIIKILMRRDGISMDEARRALKAARERVADGEDPEDVLYEEFELEPDYIEELL